MTGNPEAVIANLAAARDKLLADLAGCLLEMDKSLENIKLLFVANGFAFANDRVAGFANEGIVIGKRVNADGEKTPLALVGGRVYEVSADGHKIHGTDIKLEDFLLYADLDTVESGFDYLRQSQYIKKINARNNALQDLLLKLTYSH